jgi:nitrogen regulatory protein PII
MSKQNEFEIAVRSNDFDKVKELLSRKTICPSTYKFYAIGYAAQKGYLETFELLLNDKRAELTTWHNAAIRSAYERKHFNIVKILWKNEQVKATLKEDDNKLYKKLTTEHIQKNINKF